ncbi:TPM domain-containing protein [Archangium lipolyticum]|uniref:TPM domain-containing protein n=1 Tax=Archangium lipolyticum TaxID=2970465 RepID=UPI00214A1DDC|nr:TPM domain-containing protein [Archangium lipolyticum]
MRALLSCLLLLCFLALPARSETVGSIPQPVSGSWVVDTTGTLSSSTLAGVNQWGRDVDGQGLGQLAVVVVGTTGGRNPRTFATELFNRWGIGHAGRDDGALLFIALKDRKVEIVLGDGVDSAEDTRRSDALMSGEIIPAFKRGDPDGAVLAGARGLSELLEQSPLNTSPRGTSPVPPATPERASVPAPIDVEPFHPPEPPRPSLSRRFEQAVADTSPWFLGGGAGGLVMGFVGLRRWLRRRPRICEGCRQPRQLLDEASDDAHLDAGQRREEHLGSVDYDAWWCVSCEDVRVERYGSWFTAYSKCPRCAYKTKSESSTTLRAATYDHGGTVRVDVTCKHCGYHTQFTRSTPPKTRPSSSSSGSSRGGSSGFGGGRSSGGGSSGSW